MTPWWLTNGAKSDNMDKHGKCRNEISQRRGCLQ